MQVFLQQNKQFLFLFSSLCMFVCTKKKNPVGYAWLLVNLGLQIQDSPLVPWSVAWPLISRTGFSVLLWWEIAYGNTYVLTKCNNMYYYRGKLFLNLDFFFFFWIISWSLHILTPLHDTSSTPSPSRHHRFLSFYLVVYTWFFNKKFSQYFLYISKESNKISLS